MAKRPRMGRNLNALLGSNAKDRKTQTTVQADVRADVRADDRADDTAESAPNTEADSVGGKDSTSAAQAPLSEATPEVGKGTGQDKTQQIGTASTVLRAQESVHTSVDEPAEGNKQELIGNNSEQLIMLGVEKIRRGTYQPRRLFDQELLQELADSIRAEGMIQPIIVRPFADGYELVAGERRWRASQLAGIDRIPAIVRQMEDRSVAAVSVIENIQRKDLNPLEEAEAFARLCDEFGMTHKAVAEAVGRSRASVTNLMRLLELHDEVKVMVDKSELEMGHARALLGAPRHVQRDIARRVVQQAMTVRATEAYVRSLDEDGREVRSNSADPAFDPDIERLSKKLGETLGAKVQISHKGSGAGKLQISYSSVSELQGILAHIK